MYLHVEITEVHACTSPNSPYSDSLFFSGGHLWLHEGQRRWAVISGRCHHICHQEEWWWLVRRGHEWSDGALPRELCRVHHALLRVKTWGQSSASPVAGAVRASRISTSLWGPIQNSWMKDNCNNHSFFFFFFPHYKTIVIWVVWTNGSSGCQQRGYPEPSDGELSWPIQM